MNAAESGRKQISHARSPAARLAATYASRHSTVSCTRPDDTHAHPSETTFPISTSSREMSSRHTRHVPTTAFLSSSSRFDASTPSFGLFVSPPSIARTRTRASLLVGHARVHGRRNISHIRHSPSRASDVSRTRRRRDRFIEFSAARTRDSRGISTNRIDRHSAPSRARVVVMSDDDSFVMNIADDGAGRREDEGTRARGRWRERRKRMARRRREGARGRVGARWEDKGEETRAGGLERARGRWWDVVGGDGRRDGDGGRGKSRGVGGADEDERTTRRETGEGPVRAPRTTTMGLRSFVGRARTPRMGRMGWSLILETGRV